MGRHSKKLYLDKENKKISGVCAGLADYFSWDVTMVRILVVVATIITGFWPTIVAYILMAWLLNPKPVGLSYYDDARAELDSARRDVHRPVSRFSFGDVKSRFDRVEDRL